MILSMVEPKDRLKRLEEYFPDESDGVLYEFGRYLSTCLNDRLVPAGFVLQCESALYNLQPCRNGFTRQPINSWLIDYPPAIYAGLSMKIPSIAEAIFPVDFAVEVKAVIEEMAAKV